MIVFAIMVLLSETYLQKNELRVSLPENSSLTQGNFSRKIGSDNQEKIQAAFNTLDHHKVFHSTPTHQHMLQISMILDVLKIWVK